MRFSESSLKKSYLPFLLRKTAESYQKLGDDEVAGFAVYWSESESKKPGILRRRGERIKNIALVFYPVLLTSYSSGSAVLIDPLRKSKLVVTLNVVKKELVDSALVELAASSGKSFLDVMVKIDKITEGVASGKNVVKEVVELENVVSNPSFVNDLKTLLNYTTTYSLPYIEIPWVSVNYAEVSEKIRKTLNVINDLVNYVSDVVGKVNELLDNWKVSVQKEYEKKIAALDQKIKEVREEVLKNVEELRKKKEEELAGLRDRYVPSMEAIEKRIKETQDSVKKLEEEIEKAKSYGKDVSDMRKRLSELKKTLESLEKELESEKTKYENEVKRVEKKFEELMKAENNKVKAILQERAALQHEFDSIIQEANKRSDKIRSNLQEYREGLIKVEKEIEGVSLSIPSGGEGLYMIPLIYTSYVSNGSSRSIITAPVILESGGWLGPKIRPVVVEGLSKYLSWSKDLIDKEEMRSELEAKNLLTSISPERIEVSLMRFADMGLLSKDKVKEIVNSVGEQKKMS